MSVCLSVSTYMCVSSYNVCVCLSIYVCVTEKKGFYLSRCMCVCLCVCPCLWIFVIGVLSEEEDMVVPHSSSVH